MFTENFTICVSTCGDDTWIEMAKNRAIPSAELQGVPVIYEHKDTVADARNAGLAKVETEYVIFLDADDELEPGYVEAMSKGTADVRAPRVRCCREGRMVSGGLFMPQIGHQHHRSSSHRCNRDCLPYGNWIVVGAAARTELLREIGGWGTEPIYEDWALWLRCYKAGASFEAIWDAIYRQHLYLQSRNHTGPAWEQRQMWHESIVTSVLGEIPIYHPLAHA